MVLDNHDDLGQGPSNAIGAHHGGTSRHAPTQLLAVFIGGVLGTAGRWTVGRATQGAWGYQWATLLVNLTGAALLGLLLAGLAGRPDHGRRRVLRLFLGTGLLGSWTSYSALALAALQHPAGSGWGQSIGYLLASVLGGLACADAGLRLGRALGQRPR